MASMRRTLSPVPRARASGEVFSMEKSSPLSKSSSSASDDVKYGLKPFALFSFVKQALHKMHLDRSKMKGQVWRWSLLHFSICFLAGVLFGLASLTSVPLSGNPTSKHSNIFFDMIPSVAKHQSVKFERKHVTPVVGNEPKHRETLVERFGALKNVSIDQVKEKRELVDSNENADVELVVEDTVFNLQKLLIIVTPTLSRSIQPFYLNRLAQTLKLVRPPLLWIVVDMTSQSTVTADILRRSGVMYRHLVCDKNAAELKNPYAHQRNVALSHIETHRLDGIVYFANDDNIYSVELFEKMIQISRFGTWRVAQLSLSGVLIGGPVCNTTEVIGWHTTETDGRFHAEISGFAFNSTILWDPKRWHRLVLDPIRQLISMEETLQMSAFIGQLVEDESQMECLPKSSSSIFVWQSLLESSSSTNTQPWATREAVDLTALVP